VTRLRCDAHGWAERRFLGTALRLAHRRPRPITPDHTRSGRTAGPSAHRSVDVQRIEINEAFAAIVIAVTKDLGLSEDVVNVEGGAIAHGHPIGATGAVLTSRILHSMQRDGIKRGIVTLCIGGGQGIALAVETLQ
jgi:thiolase-like protein